MDPIEADLAEAGRTVADDEGVQAALQDVMAAVVRQRGRRRRLRVVVPAAAVGGVLALGGAGAAIAAAIHWGPWDQVPEPDYVIARDWHDATGAYLGSCESRVDVEAVDEQVRSAVREFFAEQDVATLAPEPRFVAVELSALGRAEDLPRLVPGAEPADYGVGPEDQGYGSWVGTSTQAWLSDARILQDALVSTVGTGVNDILFREGPSGLGSLGIGSLIQTQCTTDPTATPTP